jgi:Tfp pilus assembly protein PilF
VRPEILFPAYLAGHNLIEAFYLAIPHLSWQTVVIGDPLCAPFPRKPLSRAELDAGLDAETELPGFFSKRRLAASSASQPGTPARAVSLLVRAETMALRGDVPRARQALEEAVDAAPDAVAPRLQLALLQEQTGQHAAAEEGYRRALTLQPNNAVALNNLAYALAVRKKSPKEGLPFAKRAVALSPNDPNVIDTLAWIEHLTGNDVEAARLMAAAIKSSPGSPEIRLHAAIIYAARGALAVSETELKEALRLAPALEQSEDVKQLRVRLLELEKGAR